MKTAHQNPEVLTSFDFDTLDLSDVGTLDLEDDDPFGFASDAAKAKAIANSQATSGVVTAVLIPVTDAIIHQLGEKVFPIKINGIHDTRGLALAKAAKKQCVEIRGMIESSRVEIKKPYLEMGRKIDAEAKRLQEALEPAESYITGQIETVEKSLKKIEQERLDRLYAKRKQELEAINLHLPEASVRAMSDEDFANLVERTLKEFEEQQEESARRAEEQRKLDAERTKQKAEADQLAAERAEVQRQQQAERAEIQRQRDELANQQREIDRQREAARQAEADRLAAIERERKEAEAKVVREQQLAEAKARAERMKPHSERLIAFAERVEALAAEAPQIDPSIDSVVAGFLTGAAGEMRWIAQGMVSTDPAMPAVIRSEMQPPELVETIDSLDFSDI